MDVPLTEPFAISGGAPAVAHNVFVRLAFDDGTVGYGEAAPFEAVSGETQQGTIGEISEISGTLVGREAAHWRDLRGALPRQPAARCAVEQALFDALARSRGLSLAEFFGGGGATALRTDITIPAGDTPHAVAAAHRAVANGFTAIKIKTGAAGWQADAERVRAVNRAAPHATIIVDANAGYTLDEARAFLADGVKVDLFEQPTPDLADLAVLDILTCADESVRSPQDALRVAGLRTIGVINVKLMKFGVIDALDVIAVARAAGLTCMIGGMIETPVSMAFSASLAAANAPLFAYIDLDTPLFMPPGLIRGGLRYTGPEIEIVEPVDLEAWFSAG